MTPLGICSKKMPLGLSLNGTFASRRASTTAASTGSQDPNRLLIAIRSSADASHVSLPPSDGGRHSAIASAGVPSPLEATAVAVALASPDVAVLAEADFVKSLGPTGQAME